MLEKILFLFSVIASPSCAFSFDLFEAICSSGASLYHLKWSLRIFSVFEFITYPLDNSW